MISALGSRRQEDQRFNIFLGCMSEVVLDYRKPGAGRERGERERREIETKVEIDRTSIENTKPILLPK